MKRFLIFILAVWGLCATCPAQYSKERLFVLTDISNEPDDEESLVRLMVYANEVDLEGLVATTSTYLKNKTRDDLIYRVVDAYGIVKSNLDKHAQGFPSAEYLKSIVRKGQPGYGMTAVGKGKATPGSELLIQAVDKQDRRPLWITVWGGANTLAQALYDVKRTRTPEALKKFISKIRVYAISDQDDAGPVIRREFPDLFYIVSPSNPSYHEYYNATWTGISGERHYKNPGGLRRDMVENPWLREHIISNHGPLGASYPPVKYIMEGDTPSYLGLINNGLGWSVSPSFGGWGGRYVKYTAYGETRPIWTHSDNSRDAVKADDGRVYTSNQATIWRWREHFQNDFAARMDWCVVPYKKANHNPIAILNGDKTQNVVYINAKRGDQVKLSAAQTSDPDGNTFEVTWYTYEEAGTSGATLSASSGLSTEVSLPQRKGNFHVIMQVKDNGNPPLCSYRRAVIRVK